MADKGLKENPINMARLMTRNLIDGVFDDLMEKNVLSVDELQKVGKGVNLIVNKAETLIENVTEKTQIVGKILKDNIFSIERKLSIKSRSESEDDDSEDKSLSPTESEDERDESRDESEDEGDENKSESEDGGEENRAEEEAGSAQALALPPIAPQEIQSFNPEHKLKLCTHDDFRRIKTTMANHIYPMMEQEGRTRLALIICNKEFKYLPERRGSEADLKGMEDLLKDLGYSVTVERNLTALEMETVLWAFAARKEHRSSDSTFLVFMTHGILDGICGKMHKDDAPDILRDDTIFQIFNNRNCQNLINKPKIIITQACRGKGSGTTWIPDMGATPACRYDRTHQCYVWSDAVTMTHVEKDFVAFKSSTPHNISWIRETNGSLFIGRLVYYLKEYSYCNHLQEIFRKVQHSFETPDELIQMPTIERVSMTRHFYLFPGI